MSKSPLRSIENTFNVVDCRPLFRAALSDLLAWLADGVEPPLCVCLAAERYDACVTSP